MSTQKHLIQFAASFFFVVLMGTSELSEAKNKQLKSHNTILEHKHHSSKSIKHKHHPHHHPHQNPKQSSHQRHRKIEKAVSGARPPSPRVDNHESP